MKITRRQFIQSGAAAVTVTFAAPEFLSDLAMAQGARARNLVILYMSGGNDALSTLIPYNDPFYYSRRPNLAVPAGNVLQVGTDSSGIALGLHPRLTALSGIFNAGRLALIQRTYARLGLEYGVTWKGRDYKLSHWDMADGINKALSATNASLYALTSAV